MKKTYKNTKIEFELTFLAKTLPKGIKKWSSSSLIDVYVPSDLKVHPYIRLRKKDNLYEITKKILIDSSDKSSHSETTIPLSKSEYLSLSNNSARRIEKTRYFGVVNGYSTEVDVFQETLSGLVLIEFEFQNREAMKTFSAPDICLSDVTQEEFISGGFLAGRTFEDIAHNLKKFGYKKLYIK